MRRITLSDYRTIGLCLSDCNFFLLSNYRNIEYRIGEFQKLSDYRISDQGMYDAFVLTIFLSLK
jgi:hypothetical protein